MVQTSSSVIPSEKLHILKLSRFWNGQVWFYLKILYFWKMNWSMNSFWSASILHRVSYSVWYLKDKASGQQLPCWVRTVLLGCREGTWASESSAEQRLRELDPRFCSASVCWTSQSSLASPAAAAAPRFSHSHQRWALSKPLAGGSTLSTRAQCRRGHLCCTDGLRG